jgi:hypothetical protein
VSAEEATREPPAELQAQMEEMGSLNIGEPEFIDLTEPWMVSPGRLVVTGHGLAIAS